MQVISLLLLVASLSAAFPQLPVGPTEGTAATPGRAAGTLGPDDVGTVGSVGTVGTVGFIPGSDLKSPDPPKPPEAIDLWTSGGPGSQPPSSPAPTAPTDTKNNRTDPKGKPQDGVPANDQKDIDWVIVFLGVCVCCIAVKLGLDTYFHKKSDIRRQEENEAETALASEEGNVHRTASLIQQSHIMDDALDAFRRSPTAVADSLQVTVPPPAFSTSPAPPYVLDPSKPNDDALIADPSDSLIMSANPILGELAEHMTMGQGDKDLQISDGESQLEQDQIQEKPETKEFSQTTADEVGDVSKEPLEKELSDRLNDEEESFEVFKEENVEENNLDESKGPSDVLEVGNAEENHLDECKEPSEVLEVGNAEENYLDESKEPSEVLKKGDDDNNYSEEDDDNNHSEEKPPSEASRGDKPLEEEELSHVSKDEVSAVTLANLSQAHE